MEIVQSTFENFDLYMDSLQAPFVDSKLKMITTGMIIDVDKFLGHIAIKGSTFTNNMIKYQNCDIIASSYADY